MRHLNGSWKIVHLELDEAAAIERPAADVGVYLVVWFAGVPLGARRFASEELPISASAVEGLIPAIVAPAIEARLREHPRTSEGADAVASLAGGPPVCDRLAEIARRPGADGGGGPLSVIVCTRDRPDALARCLDALEAARTEPDEVVVVDNAPQSPATRAVCEGRRGVTCVAEPRPGLSRARNTGIRASRGEILAFTDDDTVAHPDWLRRLRDGFTAASVGCVTGLVLPLDLAGDAQATFEFGYGGLGRGFVPRTFEPDWLLRPGGRAAPVWDIGAGANMAIRRAAIERVGGFDERLGAGAAGCSEDSELWYRLLAGGWSCRYEPWAVVFHQHRGSAEDLERQMHAYMRGHVAALLVQQARHGGSGTLRRIAFDLPRYHLKSLLGAALSGDAAELRLRRREMMGSLRGLSALRWRRQADPGSAPSTFGASYDGR